MLYSQIMFTLVMVVLVAMGGVLTLYAMKTMRKVADKVLEIAEKCMEE